MSTHEDRLRVLLRSSADEVVPAGDGLSRIQARLARRRRLRWTLLPGAALVAAGATVAVLALGGSSPTNTLTVEPGESATPTSSATPSTVKSVDPGPVLSDFAAPDPDEVVRHWLAEVGIDADVLPHDCDPCAAVRIGVGGTPVGRAELVTALVVDGVRQYQLTEVFNEQLVLTSPATGAAVPQSPTVVGTVQGYHQSIDVQLRGPSQLAQGQTMAGQEQPWSVVLSTDKTWSRAAVVARTYSDKDGSLDKLVARPVTRGGTAAPTQPSYAVLKDGHVELVTGTTSKQLTFPPAGATDRAMAYAAGRLVWVRHKAECQDDLLQLVNGKASTLLSATPGIRTPRLSPSGSVLAWVDQDCSDGPNQVQVRVGDDERAFTGPEGASVQLLDVSDTGALVVRLVTADRPEGALSYVPAGGDLATARDLLAGVSCVHHGAGTLVGEQPLLWEDCNGRSRSVRYDVQGNAVERGPLVDASDVRSAAERDGRQLLLVGNRYGGADVALFADGKLTYLTSCRNADACSTAADW